MQVLIYLHYHPLQPYYGKYQTLDLFLIEGDQLLHLSMVPIQPLNLLVKQPIRVLQHEIVLFDRHLHSEGLHVMQLSIMGLLHLGQFSLKFIFCLFKGPQIIVVDGAEVQ